MPTKNLPVDALEFLQGCEITGAEIDAYTETTDWLKCLQNLKWRPNMMRSPEDQRLAANAMAFLGRSQVIGSDVAAFVEVMNWLTAMSQPQPMAETTTPPPAPQMPPPMAETTTKVEVDTDG